MASPENKKNQTRWWKTRRAKLVGIAALGVAILGLIVWVVFFYPYVRTDDARVAATLVRIAPETNGGRVVALAFQEGDKVKKGDVVAELDHRIAEAQLKKAQARANLTATELKRVRQIVAQHGLPTKELDIAEANAATAQSELELAQVAVDNTSIRSPVDGVVVQKTTEVGNIVDAGQTLLTVVDSENAWINANIEETSVGKVRVGQPVRISVDEGGTLTGKVSEVRAAVASQFALIPADSGAGNFTKVVQRVPIKVTLDPHPHLELRAGQSVEIKIKVH